jgi:hypothetical protein
MLTQKHTNQHLLGMFFALNSLPSLPFPIWVTQHTRLAAYSYPTWPPAYSHPHMCVCMYVCMQSSPAFIPSHPEHHESPSLPGVLWLRLLDCVTHLHCAPLARFATQPEGHLFRLAGTKGTPTALLVLESCEPCIGSVPPASTKPGVFIDPVDPMTSGTAICCCCCSSRDCCCCCNGCCCCCNGCCCCCSCSWAPRGVLSSSSTSTPHHGECGAARIEEPSEKILTRTLLRCGPWPTRAKPTKAAPATISSSTCER